VFVARSPIIPVYAKKLLRLRFNLQDLRTGSGWMGLRVQNKSRDWIGTARMRIRKL